MAVPRKLQISLDQTRYYHCVSRCVRRAHLCGKDAVSGRNYEHRRQWIENRLGAVCSVFAIELVAYAIMHNHYHVVIRVSRERASNWSDLEVRERWSSLFHIPAEIDTTLLVPVWRERLSSISWFMRCINEPMARLANKEDDCTGRFWEGRFRLQALLDDAALYKCMVYVDLNPIRAGLETTPERSNFTSIRARIYHRDSHLVPFKRTDTKCAEPLPMSNRTYLELVDWTGRIIRPDKSGHIPQHHPAILDRIGIDQRRWIGEVCHYGRWYYRAVGSIGALQQYCARIGQHWLKGMSAARPKPA